MNLFNAQVQDKNTPNADDTEKNKHKSFLQAHTEIDLERTKQVWEFHQ